jgi:hypothetical protein
LIQTAGKQNAAGKGGQKMGLIVSLDDERLKQPYTTEKMFLYRDSLRAMIIECDAANAIIVRIEVEGMAKVIFKESWSPIAVQIASALCAYLKGGKG